MPMRFECRHYESRTYASGDSVQKCRLDLAPEAPWRCPADCQAFSPRMVDLAWERGRLTFPSPPPEPAAEGVAELLDQAEDIVNSAVPQVMAELADARSARDPWWRRWRPRRRR